MGHKLCDPINRNKGLKIPKFEGQYIVLQPLASLVMPVSSFQSRLINGIGRLWQKKLYQGSVTIVQRLLQFIANKMLAVAIK